MEKELKDNEELEDNFQKIKQITGLHDLHKIVDKVLNKEKNYNYQVSLVSQKETRLEVLKKVNKELDDEHKRIKTDSKYFTLKKCLKMWKKTYRQ
jgi:hypothetical protein